MVDTTDFDPAFNDDLQRFLAFAQARGINPNVISGYRSLQDQQQLYANYQAGRSGQPLPYPARGAVQLAARPGSSPHEFGIAADLGGITPQQQAQMRGWAPQFGLAGIANDPGHYQLAGVSPAQYANYGPNSQNALAYSNMPAPPNAPAAAAINAQAPPAQGLNLNSAPPPPSVASAGAAPPPGTTLNSTPTFGQNNPFIHALGNAESGWQNIYSRVDPNVSGPNTRSQGFLQINTPTWQQFQGAAGVTAPNAMSASMADQIAVGSQIPFSRFGPRTQALMQKQFGPIDPHQTVGQLASQFAGPNAGVNGPGPIDPSAIANSNIVAGGPASANFVNPPIPDNTQAPTPATPAIGLAALPSALKKTAKDPSQGDQGQQQGSKAPPMPPPPPAHPAGDPGTLQAVQQILARYGQPLQIGMGPPGINMASMAGLQPGMTLNSPSMQQLQMMAAGGF